MTKGGQYRYDQLYTKIQIINNQIVKTDKHIPCVRK
jgi:hypothetical protein